MPKDGLPEFKPLVPVLPQAASITRPPTPQTVEAAFWLIIASTAINVCVLLIGSFAIVLSGANLANPYYVVGTVVALGLRILFAFAVRQGAGFVRILLALGAVLGVMGLVMSFSVISLVLVVIAIGIVILLWLPSSNAFFRAAGASRAAVKARSLPR